jgi:hypothetical protein
MAENSETVLCLTARFSHIAAGEVVIRHDDHFRKLSSKFPAKHSRCDLNALDTTGALPPDE